MGDAGAVRVDAGANVKAVQRMLGHASAAMTLDVYAGLFDDDLDGVADRLDALGPRCCCCPSVAQGARCRSLGGSRDGCRPMITGPVLGAA
jgi:hypothetical protein